MQIKCLFWNKKKYDTGSFTYSSEDHNKVYLKHKGKTVY